jgi:hypothetical protein
MIRTKSTSKRTVPTTHSCAVPKGFGAELACLLSTV